MIQTPIPAEESATLQGSSQHLLASPRNRKGPYTEFVCRYEQKHQEKLTNQKDARSVDDEDRQTSPCQGFDEIELRE